MFSLKIDLHELEWTKYGYEPKADVLKLVFDNFNEFEVRREATW